MRASPDVGRTPRTLARADISIIAVGNKVDIKDKPPRRYVALVWHM